MIWSTTARRATFIGLLAFIGACGWTPQVETVLHESPDGIVSLRTISDNSIRANHPIDIPNTTMKRVLRGVYSFRDVRLIENLVSGDPEPVRLFSPSQVTFLTPLLTSAFAQATSEEEVFFQCSSSHGSGPPVTGTMLVHNSTLFLTWTEPLSKPKVLAKQHRPSSGLPDPSMPQDHTILFSPKAALMTGDQSVRSYLRHLEVNTLAIDYQLLAQLPVSKGEGPTANAGEADEPMAEGRKSKSRVEGPAGSHAREEPSAADSRLGTGSPSLSESTAEAKEEIRTMKEQMKKLQQELTKQKEELNRLKGKQP